MEQHVKYFAVHFYDVPILFHAVKDLNRVAIMRGGKYSNYSGNYFF